MQHIHLGTGTRDIMLVSLEVGEVTVLALVHHHISKVKAREAYLRRKVQFDAKMDGSTDAFQFFWSDVDFVIFLCSVHETNCLSPCNKQPQVHMHLHRVIAREGRENGIYLQQLSNMCCHLQFVSSSLSFMLLWACCYTAVSIKYCTFHTSITQPVLYKWQHIVPC